MNYTTMNAQRPTFQGLRVRSPQDAHVIFHAVNLELAPIVARRLDTDEKRSICSGLAPPPAANEVLMYCLYRLGVCLGGAVVTH